MRKNFLKYSILLSVVCIAITVVVNGIIAKEYFESTGKRKAFFDLHAAINYIFRYYIAIPALLALLLAFFSSRPSSTISRRYTAIILGFVSFVLVFAKLWRMFVWIVE